MSGTSSDQDKCKERFKLKPTPADVDDLIRKLDAILIDKKIKKFYVYLFERLVYGPDTSDEFMIFCLTSFFVFKQKYNAVSTVYKLPSLTLLREQVINSIKIKPGINEQLVQLIKIKTDTYKLLHKVVVLLMDEKILEPPLELNEQLKFGGGELETDKLACFVTNITIRSVGGEWDLPFAFIFTSEMASVAELKDLLYESVMKLTDIGLNVIGIVTRMHPNFYELSAELNISPTNPIFNVGSKKLVFVFEILELMNITRDNMMKYIFKFDQYQTSWNDVKAFFLKHIKSNCTQCGTEILSNSVTKEMKMFVSAGKPPETALETAEFMTLFNKLFGILTSQGSCIKEFDTNFKGSKNQISFIEKMIQFLEKLKVFNKNNQDCTNQVKFITCWLISIKALTKLTNIFKTRGYPELLTRFINCQTLEFLEKICFRYPISSNILDEYRKYFIGSYLCQGYFIPDKKSFDLDNCIKKVYRTVPATKHNAEIEVRFEDLNLVGIVTPENFGNFGEKIVEDLMKWFGQEYP